MLSLERQQEIISYMKNKNIVTVCELSKRFFISETTIRRDLEKLEKQHLIKRTYGGAIFLNGLNNDIPLLLRQNENNNSKEEIAHAASRFIKDGMTVFMDSSSSVIKLIPYFADKKGITIVTNALRTAVKLSNYSDLTLYCPSGKIYKKSVSLTGESVCDFFSRFYADIVFFSCRGLSLRQGITDSTYEEAKIKRQMLINAKTKVLLCDSTKLHQIYFSQICTVDTVDYILLDSNAPDESVETLKAARPSIFRGNYQVK